MKPAALVFFVLTMAILEPAPVRSDEIRVAAASNFRDAATEIAAQFEAQSPHKVSLIFGSTGKHYAQIINGAPFDIFFAADAERPLRLEKEGFSVPGSRFTYAVGRLVLWSPDEGRVDPDGAVIGKMEYRHLAIANPELAPYGRAAKETLQSMDLWDSIAGRLVRGENIGQTFQFVISGNAELGLVAWSQLQHGNSEVTGSWWLVPDTLYRPIEQQALQLAPGEAARSFLAFVQAEKAVEIIRAHGYGVPDDF